jgi:hypothetical protein
VTRTVTIVVGGGGPVVAAEALRAAVGLTLRGDAITVVLDPTAPVDGPEPARARATLELFGHTVAGASALGAALDADAIEIWGGWVASALIIPRPAARTRTVLHVVRAGRQPQGVAAGDRVVDLDALDDDQLLDHVLAAGTVAVW